MEPMKTVTKNGRPMQVFLGVPFYLKPSGYYRTRDNCEVWGERRLHRAVWAHHNGPVPVGCIVHHKDHNKDNNNSSNLEAMPKEIHDSVEKKLQSNRVCPVCKNIFLATKSALYCTSKCSKTAARLRAGAKPNNRTPNVVKFFVCVECGAQGEHKTFIHITNKLYCSTRCKRRAKDKRRKVQLSV